MTSTVLDEDARRRSSGSQDDQALVSHGGQPGRNPARRVQCYNCEKMGHFSSDCPEPPKQHSQAALTHRGGRRPKNNRKPTSYRKPSYKAEGRGSVKLRVRDDKDAERVIRLSSVFFVPDLSCNLFSVCDITDKGNRMLFDKGRLCDCKWTQARESVRVRWDRG